MLTGILLIILSLAAIWLSEAATWVARFHPARDKAALQWGLVALGGIGLLAGVFVAFTGRALAGEAAPPVADLRPLWGYGVEIAFTLLAALGTWGIKRLSTYLGIKEEDRVRDYLDMALTRALQYGVEVAARRGEDFAQVQVRDKMIAVAANYAATAVPDALRRFGIDGPGLEQRLRARLPEIAPHPSQPTAFGAPIRHSAG